MLPIMKQNGTAGEKKLRELFRKLGEHEQDMLLRFAEFLSTSPASAVAPVREVLPEPEGIERPAQESVIKAIKRLSATYPMLNRDHLLHETSDLMSSHVLKGLPAAEVIDELESMFARHYQLLKTQFEQNC